MSFVYFLISYPHCAIAMLVLAAAFAFLNSKINLIGDQLDAFDELYENDADMIDRALKDSRTTPDTRIAELIT